MEDTGKTIALIKAFGGSGGALPPITAADDGKVLTANSGVWVASGNIVLEGTRSGEDVTITTSPLPSHDAFVNAYKMGRGITLVLNDVETIYLLPFEQITSENSVTFYGIGLDFDYRKCAVYIHEMNGTVNVQFTSLDKFIVTLTPTALDYSGTMDKTVEEITAAHEAGQEIVFRVMTSATSYMEVDCTARYYANGSTYPSFNAYIVDDGGVLIYAYTGTTNGGTNQTYFTHVYTLTPAT